MDLTAAIADHNGVLDDEPGLDDIDRHKAGAVQVDRVAAGLPGSEARQAQVGKPIARKIDLIETAPTVERTEAHHNAWSDVFLSDGKNGKGVVTLQRRVRTS